MKYNCIVVDDNLIERDLIKMHLERLGSLNVIAECENAQQAIQTAATNRIDIIFSDVQMPDMNGFELSRSFRVAPVFVFITSFTEFAAESFNVDAIDFVVKPASFERLQKAANKAIEYLELKKCFTEHKLNRKEDQENVIITKTADAQDFFFIKETNGFTKLHYADVLYVESMGDFSRIYTVQNVKHVILVSLKNFENQLPSAIFKRVHKQYVVNVWQIATITLTEVILNNKIPIPISNIYRHDLMDKVVNKKLLSRK